MIPVMGSKSMLLHSALFPLCISLMCCSSFGSDTISLGQSLYANQTIVSKQAKFELGFFSPSNSSSNYYLGIWYKNLPIKTVVWVANRDSPISPTLNGSYLQLSNGSLILHSGLGQTVWATSNPAFSSGIQLILLDNGNLVLKDIGEVRWQSFDYPTDTLLPGARIGYDEERNKSVTLTSWRNQNDSATGLYSVGMDPSGGDELFIWRNGKRIFWRSGTYNGGSFPLIPLNNASFSYVSRGDSKYVVYNVYNETIPSRIVIDFSGMLREFVWSDIVQRWTLRLSRPSDQCDSYGMCGAFGVCSISNSPVCSCLNHFVPRTPQAWNLQDFSGGCVRENPLQCGRDKVGFDRIPDMKLPAYSETLDVGKTEICEFSCSLNCSCSAYSYSSIGGCLLWSGDLLDLQRAQNGTNGQDLYLKLNALALPAESAGRKITKRVALPISLTSAIVMSIVFFGYMWRRKLKSKNKGVLHDRSQNLLLLDLSTDALSNGGGRAKNFELPILSFSSIVAATDNFSAENRIGEGGFGPVFKGNLLNGQSVAVKRLSKKSGQGLEEFRNEIQVIAKLQHRNLVRILGCCIEQDEKILVYEYMANKSLDSYLFNPAKRGLLDWSRRVQIIEGIAQGLLYLHQYSRLRIVHRDLKASNILLDGDMNPKISDFGMARIFGGNELQANTNRIVGTYGYMSPEYAMEGFFSTKSDVFAFGVLLLEILSGQRNTGFYGSDYLSLLGYAWELWQKERALELMDEDLEIPSHSHAALKYIHIGLCCVQENPAERPDMSSVISMMGNEHSTLPSPKQPAFIARNALKKGSDRGEVEACSVNKLTITSMEAR